MEGQEPLSGGRVIIFSFPSEAAADEWYNDPEYQELSKFRKEGAPLRSLSLIKGLPPRSWFIQKKWSKSEEEASHQQTLVHWLTYSHKIFLLCATIYVLKRKSIKK